MKIIIHNKNKQVRANATGTHIGANTHHQLQLMTPVNFNTMNAIVSNPKNEVPPIVVFSSVSFSMLFLIVSVIN